MEPERAPGPVFSPRTDQTTRGELIPATPWPVCFCLIVNGLFALAGLLAGCHSNAADPGPGPTPKGSRRLGLHITQTEANLFSSPDGFKREFSRAKAAGMDVVPLAIFWNAFEPKAGTWNLTVADFANLYYPSQQLPVCLTVSPINALSKAFPADLAGRAFNDPLVVSRFNAFLDTLHRHIPQVQVQALILGNEVDQYLNPHANEWDAYQTLFESARQRARTLWGTAIQVGVENTLQAGYMGANRARVQALNTRSDFLAITYYPLNADFTMKSPAEARQAWVDWLAAFPAKAVVVEETGYASSAANNSSDAAQAEYVQTMFGVWDAYATRIQLVNFVWLNDLSESQAQSLVSDYGGQALPEVTRNRLKEYLRTLGLRTYTGSGTDKAAFTVLQAEARARGWPVQ